MFAGSAGIGVQRTVGVAAHRLCLLFLVSLRVDGDRIGVGDCDGAVVVPVAGKSDWWFTVGFLVLLFVGAARSKWWERGDIPKGVWSIYSNRENPASASATVVGTARIVTDILYSGPRLLISAWRTIEKSLRYWRLDVALCASVLTLVLNAGKAVSRQELMERLPSAFTWPEVEQHLRQIKGVLFLEHGLTLTEDMRLELSQQLHASPRSHP